MRKSVKSSFAKRAMAMLLVLMMAFSSSVSAFAVDGSSLSGDTSITASGGDALISDGVPDYELSDSNSLDSILDNIPDDLDEEDPNLDDGDSPNFESQESQTPLSDDPVETANQVNAQPDWLKDYLETVLNWTQTSSSSRLGMMRAARSGVSPSFSFISWSGELVMGNSSNPAHMDGYPGIPEISLNGDVTFCGEWNGVPPGGSYSPTGEGNDNKIKQILANFDNSAQGEAEYAAAQVAIWVHLLGISESAISWGGCPGASAWSEIAHCTCDYSDLKYNYIKWGGGAQNLITYHIDDFPDIGDDDDDDDDDAFGQVTVVKKDDEGRSLDDPVFSIDITFSNGDTGGTSAF